MTRVNFLSFLNALGHEESRNNYSAVNDLGFTGKYQFGEAILIDTGYYTAKPGTYYNGGGNGVTRNNWDELNKKWTEKAKKYKVSRYEQFVGNVKIQEAAIRDAFNFNLEHIKDNIKQKGSLEDFLKMRGYTLSGILAAAHLQGAWGAAELLINGTDRFDENKTSMIKYAKMFSGYDFNEDDIMHY